MASNSHPSTLVSIAVLTMGSRQAVHYHVKHCCPVLTAAPAAHTNPTRSFRDPDTTVIEPADLKYVCTLPEDFLLVGLVCVSVAVAQSKATVPSQPCPM